jgi:hypothetical protein
VNAGVANQARLVLHGLVVRRSGGRPGGEVWRRRVTLQADRIYVGAIEQARIRSSMGRVAGYAALGLDYVVLIDKGPRSFRMALHADRILLRGGLEAFLFECSVRIVAIGALHQAFIHLVVKGHGELRLHIGVALVAERRLRRLEQSLFLARVNVVAAQAANVTFGMRGAIEVLVLALMAAQALGVDIRNARGRGVEDLGLVAACLHMRFSRAVAVFASHALAAVHLGHLGVRVGREALGHFFVTGRAHLGADKVPRRGVLALGRGRLRSRRFGSQIGLGAGTGRGNRTGQDDPARNGEGHRQLYVESQSRQSIQSLADWQLLHEFIDLHGKTPPLDSRVHDLKTAERRILLAERGTLPSRIETRNTSLR